MLYVVALAVIGAAVAFPFLGLTKLTEWIHRRCDPNEP